VGCEAGKRLRTGGGGLLDRDDNLEVGARLLGRRCKDLVGGGLIAEPDTPSFSITEADVGHVFVGEQNLANVARLDPPQESVLWRQDVLLGRPRGDDYGRRVSLDGGRFVASLATQEAEDGHSDKGRPSPHHFVRRRQAADCSRPGVKPERLRKGVGMQDAQLMAMALLARTNRRSPLRFGASESSCGPDSIHTVAPCARQASRTASPKMRTPPIRRMVRYPS
jgi:hypothetical protein